MNSVFDKLGAIPRRLRWALHRWSPAADREFHDALFRAQRYNPFSYAYPGYITIRRFAALTEPHLQDVRHAVDLGCGPAEITCELARRNPGVTFFGVDHSEAAIARAREHKAALDLANIEFAVGDVATFEPERADIILMYDSFHHLVDPAGFVARLKPTVARFLLVEPSGDWLGGWQKALDFDWIPRAIDDIRARLAWQMNEAAPAASSSVPESEERGAAVEHRYPLAELKRFFDGYGLDVRGTVAGIGEYPPNPYATLPLREEFGRIAADVMADIDDVLLRHDVDLHAKHWVVYAERGAPHRLRSPRPINPRSGVPPAGTPGPYDVEYLSADAPGTASAGSTFHVDVAIKNRGWRPWQSDAIAGPVFASYHWLNANGDVSIHDGRRTPFPERLLPSASTTLKMTVDAPAKPGRYILAIDLVEEGVTWFSETGVKMLELPMNIR